MPPNSEIEKLERRWRDNPKGTVFAPYAEVLRKNGDHALARDVLRQGLELHPDHIPGNIVLGRCCLDLGEDGPAEAAFAHVLDLDSENVIALKALADITERQGRLAEADNWLNRLVSVDPSNDEARDQIARVNAAREVAAVAIAADAIQKPEPPAPTVKTLEIPISRLLNPEPLDDVPEMADRAEAGQGEIDDVGDVAAFADEALDKFLDAPSGAGEPASGEGRVRSRNDSEVTAVTPAFRVDPTPISGLEPAELDLSEATRELTPIADLKLDEDLLLPPAESEVTQEPIAEAPAPPRTSAPYAIGVETASEIELSPAGSSEFQSPDDSAALLDITPGQSEFQVPDASSDLNISIAGKSEFQTPDASEDLRFSGNTASEYQTPSGAEELLRPTSSSTEPAPEPEAAEAVIEKSWGDAGVSSTLASIAAMPTEELSTELPVEQPPAQEPPAEAPKPSTPSWFFDDEEPDQAAAPSAATPLPLIEPETESEPEISAPATEVESVELIESVVAEEPVEQVMVPVIAEPDRQILSEAAPEPVVEAESRSSAELRLIFPDDAAQPEPHRVRRITQAEITPPDEAAEAPMGEPEPVMTETMAELYARQGHTGEALRVYRSLAEKHPGDSRLRDRIRELEARGGGAPRRHTFVAVDTGGESVESFFRSLAEARPGSGGTIPQFDSPGGNEDNSGAPTRPARDPLSLSAIFGEEPAARGNTQGNDAPANKSAGGPDAFSFDQFFGSSPASGSGSSSARPSGASEEDLDQFQNWLKSLKR